VQLTDLGPEYYAARLEQNLRLAEEASHPGVRDIHHHYAEMYRLLLRQDADAPLEVA